jgi:hypothetical protein
MTHSGKGLKDTGTWILETSQFCDWRDCSKSSLLWVSGAFGTSKTVLAPHVVQYLAKLDTNEQSLVALYFFGRLVQPERPSEALAAAIISQMVYQSHDFDPGLVRAYETSKRFGRPRMSHLDDTLGLLKEMAGRWRPLNLVLDGLDECDGATDVLTAVKELLAIAANIHVIVFSRDAPRTRMHLSFGVSIALDATRNRQDIDRFARDSGARLMLNDPALEEDIINTVTWRADGMFLWAAHVVESLRAATNPGEVLELLNGTLPGIDAYYSMCF